ncbi:MAG: 50S ribosomal protein L25 [Elusimicrobia bacterium]|nr:50S ribosomal protein L25 [Elusimicrobiota bacterium]
MEEIKVAAELRGEKNTRNQLSELRKARKIPAVVYGGAGGPVSVIVPEKALIEALKKAGANAIIHLQHPKGTDTVILKELQRNVVTGEPMHADFKRISLKEKIDVQVPIRAVGEAPGVKLQGGLLEHILRHIEVRCLPTEIPQSIDVDVSALNVGQAVLVQDLKLPAGVETHAKPDQVVVHVVIVKVEEAPAPAAAAEGAAAPGAEPEVIAKGKKEEGAEGEAPAAGDKKAAAPAAKEGAKKEGAKKEGK